MNIGAKKIALSTSYFEYPIVQKILKSCDVIYTTQIQNRDALYILFCKEKVFFIPCSHPSMLNLIRRWHGPGAEYITFFDLHRAIVEEQ